MYPFETFQNFYTKQHDFEFAGQKANKEFHKLGQREQWSVLKIFYRLRSSQAAEPTQANLFSGLIFHNLSTEPCQQ